MTSAPPSGPPDDASSGPLDPFELVDDDRRDRLALVGLSVAALAHELRNRLSVIRGFAELARRGDDARAKQMATEIERVAIAAGDRLEAFLDLASARPQAPMLLADLIEDVAHLARPVALQRDKRLDYVVSAAPAFRVDPTDLRPALLDLAFNAIAHAKSRLRLRVEPDPAGARLIVDDDGPGLDAPSVPNDYRPFESTRPGGTGLGLASAARALQKMGGTLTHGRSPLGGASFVAFVPRPGTASGGEP